MDWDKLRLFHAVAKAGSFTRAGAAVNLSQSAISRQIGALEESLKVNLFRRHARGLALTEQGRLLLEATREIEARLAAVEARLYESRTRPAGPLRITATVGFGSIWLTPRMKEFIALYPNIEVTLILDDRGLDLAMGEADIALRMAPPLQPNLIQRRLMTMRFHAYAAQSYIAQFGRPQSPEELDRHRLVVYGDAVTHPRFPNARWLLTVGAAAGVARRPVLTLNTVYGVFRAVQSGIGIAALPDYLGQADPNLVRVLPEFEGQKADVFFVYPKELRNARRLAVFRDFLIAKVEGGAG